ncbi:MAG: hypothetical protein AAGG48_15680 [Planctomycetota bacterium]
MTFDQTVLFWTALVPAVLAAGAVALGLTVKRIPNGTKTQLDVLVFSLGWWAAIAVSLYGRQGWPDAEWQLCLWPLTAWIVVTWLLSFNGCSSEAGRRTDTSWLACIVAAASGLTAYICLPRGEVWEDTYDLHGPWGILLTLTMMLNAWSLSVMVRRHAERWVMLVALASLGGPVALAAATYGSLTEWSVAMVSATIVFTFCGLVFPTSRVWEIAPIASAAGTCVIAAGRFQTFETYPSWLYGTMLFLPSGIAAVDFFVRRQATWKRVSIAGILAAAFVTTFIWFLLIRETESW